MLRGMALIHPSVCFLHSSSLCWQWQHQNHRFYMVLKLLTFGKWVCNFTFSLARQPYFALHVCWSFQCHYCLEDNVIKGGYLLLIHMGPSLTAYTSAVRVLCPMLQQTSRKTWRMRTTWPSGTLPSWLPPFRPRVGKWWSGSKSAESDWDKGWTLSIQIWKQSASKSLQLIQTEMKVGPCLFKSENSQSASKSLQLVQTEMKVGPCPFKSEISQRK